MESLLGVDFGALIQIRIAIDVVFTDEHAPRNAKEPLRIEDQLGEIGDRSDPTGKFHGGIGKSVPSRGACDEPRDLLRVRHRVPVNELGSARVPREIELVGSGPGQRPNLGHQALQRKIGSRPAARSTEALKVREAIGGEQRSEEHRTCAFGKRREERRVLRGPSSIPMDVDEERSALPSVVGHIEMVRERRFTRDGADDNRPGLDGYQSSHRQS